MNSGPPEVALRQVPYRSVLFFSNPPFRFAEKADKTEHNEP